MTITGRDVYGKTYQVDTDSLQWRPSVYGLVIKEGKILLSRQFGDKFGLPGGGVDLGERLEDAVVREVKEETGVEVKPVKLITTADSFFVWPGEAKQVNYHSILTYYLCEYLGGELSIDGVEPDEDYIDMPEWIPLEEAYKVPYASTYDFREVIKLAAQEVTA